MADGKLVKLEKPETSELVTIELLRNTSVHWTTTFATENPSSVWRTLLTDHRRSMDVFRDMELKDGQISSNLQRGVTIKNRKSVGG
jgi:hypothetical protein